MSEQKNYALYHLLMFYWKKKIWFLIMPIIGALLGLLISFAWPMDEKYIGKSNVFTGTINLQGVTVPEQIESKYGSHFTSNFDIFVPNRNYIQLEIKNDQKEIIEEELQTYHDALMAELLKQYEVRVDVTETYVQSLEDRIEKLKQSITQYQESISSTQNLAEITNFSNLLLSAESALSENMVTVQRVKNDLAFFEPPFLVKNEVKETSSYTLEWTLAGLLLGLFLSVLLLTLWQYIERARKDLKHD
ncbi:MAG: hypothetical protein R3250_00195 [Melioribacteraceae bacterium]|nr:hypothetical protein [Melioribacteraceae bacterium]